nr:hypothetical protein [Mycoplasmopsis bovis]
MSLGPADIYGQIASRTANSIDITIKQIKNMMMLIITTKCH